MIVVKNKQAVHMRVRHMQSSLTTDIRYMQRNKMPSRYGDESLLACSTYSEVAVNTCCNHIANCVYRSVCTDE